MKNLHEVVLKLKRTSFRYVEVNIMPWYNSAEQDPEKANTYKVQLVLETAKGRVLGSQRKWDAAMKEYVPVNAYDVDVVYVQAPILEKYKDQFVVLEQDEQENVLLGEYSGDLILDVMMSEEVILTDQPIFAWQKGKRADEMKSQDAERIAILREKAAKYSK